MALTTPPIVGEPHPSWSSASPIATTVPPVAAAAERRAAGVLDQARRIDLANRIAAVLAASTRARRTDAAACPATRAQVVAARGRLLDLEHVLRSGIPLTRHGEHLVQRVVEDTHAGAYAAPGPRSLHDDAEEACAALGSVTPFH